MVNKKLADLIALQGLDEISQGRIHKQGKISFWKGNESMYYNVKAMLTDTRTNIALGQMQEFVHTLLSKIDNPLVFKYLKRKNSQLKRVQYLNAIKKVDADDGFWDLKDIVGKKQGIIYGRVVNAYYASSDNGYESHLDPIDVYDFLIDPSANGIDIESAMYMGHWGVVKTITQLKEGVKSKVYHSGMVKELIEGAGNNTELNQEEQNKRARTYDTNVVGDKEVPNKNKFKFWQWVTTYEGIRYYLLMDNKGRWIRCEVLKDMFMSNLFPYWTYAVFPDLTEFWTPGYCDYIREILMAQEITIDEMMDNAEAINNPQKVVQVGAIDDMSKVIKYKKGGIIPVKKGISADAAIQFVKVPSISTPLLVFDKLQAIKDRATGINDGAAGVADPGGKVGIYEGNQVAAADRFGLLNKSYSFGYKRFAKLYEWGIKEHLIKKKAIDILGPDGVEVKNISKRDIFKKGDEFGCMVEASDAEVTNSLRNQSTKTAFLTAQIGNPLVNQSKAFEMSAKISGLNEDEIRELLDVQNFGNEELMAEADRDIESLLEGTKIEPNEMANTAYKQKMVTYLRNHKEDINFKQFAEIAEYIVSLDSIITRNEVRNLQNAQIDDLNNSLNQPVDEKGLPIQSNTQANVPLPVKKL